MDIFSHRQNLDSAQYGIDELAADYPVESVEQAEEFEKEWRRFYLSVRAKFILSLTIATIWTALSIWLSQRWLNELAEIAGLTIALIAIGFIAYVPGFMNAFLISTLLLDRKPPQRQIAEYPGLTVLVAAYNEATGIADTLTSLAKQDYRGTYQVIVLNDGSTDNTADIIRKQLDTLPIPPNASFRLMNFEKNRGEIGGSQ